MGIVNEGSIKLDISMSKIVSRKMEVFYNPVMELNRTVSVLLLGCIHRNDLQIGLPLAGSGVRGLRFIKELPKDKVQSVSFNDSNPSAVKAIKRNLRLNGLKASGKINVGVNDANLFLLESKGFDYIDIDPYGSPNPFLDSTVRRISRGGIIGITATDTSALCGTHPKACSRKYWATPLRNELMHEVGLRILIRKCQLIGAQYDKALVPIYSYSKEHYKRVFFRCEKGKSKVDLVLENIGMFDGSGPLWLGELWDPKIARGIYLAGRKTDSSNFLKMIYEESKVKSVGFFDIPSIAKKRKWTSLPPLETILAFFKKKGIPAARSHFSDQAIRAKIESFPPKIIYSHKSKNIKKR